MNGSWLQSELKTNGMSVTDLENGTGLDGAAVSALLADTEGTRPEWNAVLSWLNSLPTLDYPAPSILDEISRNMESAGQDAPCVVYYGVNAKDLIFCGYRNLVDMEYHGANVPVEELAGLHLPLSEAYTLFFKQNCTE